MSTLLDIMPESLKKQVATDDKATLQANLSKAYRNVTKTRKKLKLAKGHGRETLVSRLNQQEKTVTRLIQKLNHINTKS